MEFTKVELEFFKFPSKIVFDVSHNFYNCRHVAYHWKALTDYNKATYILELFVFFMGVIVCRRLYISSEDIIILREAGI